MQARMLCLFTAFLAIFPFVCECQSSMIMSREQKISLYEYDLDNSTIISNIPLNELNPRAFRHYSRNYSSDGGETWSRTSAGLLASGSNGEKKYRIFYSAKGRFIYSMIYYDGKQSSPELRRIVDRNYPGFELKSVVELFDRNKLTYGLTINKQGLNRLLEYHNGELNTLAEYIAQ
ncbi:MAG TPA: hypothetical protein VKR32_19835 [Puia sp.]|nr:hypothetical protein [Puia sp.]